MADNSSIPVASGNETFANKDIAGIKYPRHITVDSTGADVAVATGAKQDTGNTSLSNIDGKTPALGQALAAASVPVILPAATITTLTPPTTVTANLGTIAGVATASLQGTGNTSLASIDTKLTSQATAANQTTANTSLATLAGAVSSAKVATKAASGDFADGAINTLGARTDAKSTATDATSVSAMQVLKQISASVQGTLNVGSHAVTVSAGSALMGKVTIGNGTNDATIRAGSSAVALTDPALVVAMRPDSLADPFAQYEAVAASQANQVMGTTTGAVGDYLAGVIIIPSTTSPGAVTIKDGANAAITIFAGGATSINNLRPIVVPLGLYSTNGGWQITTGANETAIGVGKFT
jgi:hypothetical protein